MNSPDDVGRKIMSYIDFIYTFSHTGALDIPIAIRAWGSADAKLARDTINLSGTKAILNEEIRTYRLNNPEGDDGCAYDMTLSPDFLEATRVWHRTFRDKIPFDEFIKSYYENR